MKSQRLLYKKINKRDKTRYIHQVMTDNVMRYITGGGLSLEKAQKRFDEALAFSSSKRKFGIFTVWLKDTGEYIGLARLKLEEDRSVEIGYNLLEAFWGQGYGTEIGKTLMAFLKEIDCTDIYALVEMENIASRKILENLGLKQTDEKMDLTAVVYRYL
jgi:[ribosomal protein S5]-alanine N-acetyltransferase